MQSRFLLQIVDRQTGDVLRLEPGLSVEKQFVEDAADLAITYLTTHMSGGFRLHLSEAVKARGVGVLRSTTHVLQDVEDATKQVFAEATPFIREQIKAGLERAILDLKQLIKTEGR